LKAKEVIRPLRPTFGGPFATRPGRPLEPDYQIPACYTVSNVPPMMEKLPHFADETLFMIFFNYTEDIMQEMAAIELYVSPVL
jgi:CCR4-NOT transcription complex subunit 2